MKPDTMEYASILLEKRLAEARMAVSPYVIRDARTEVWADHVSDSLIASLRTHVLTHSVDRQDVRVPFRRVATAEVSSPRYLLWMYVPVLALTAYGIARGSAVTVALACLVAALTVVIYVANPPSEVVAVAEGEAVVRREQFRTFPDAAIRYPTTLGAIQVPIATTDSWAHYRDDPDT